MRSVLPALLVASLLAPARPALAEDIGGVEDAPLIRRQLLLRGGRHEATAGLGISLNDAFVRGYAPTFGYTYYLFNWFGVGADFGYNLCAALGDTCKTDLAQQIELVDPSLGPGDLADLSVITFVVTPHITLVPISGKLGLVGSTVVNWDIHLTVGGALIGTDNIGDGDVVQSGTTLAPMIGLGERFYLGNSMAITISLRNYLISRVLNAPTAGEITGAEAAQEGLENRFMLNISASFYFPPRVQTGH